MARPTLGGIPFLEQLYVLGRPANVTLPALIMLTGYCVGGGSLFQTDWQLIMLILAGFLIHSGLTIINDLSDRKVDIDNGVKTIITKGTVRDVKNVWVGALLLIAIGFGLTLWLPILLQVTSWVMTVIGIAYNCRPLLLSHRPHVSIISLGIIYGTLPFFVGYFLHGSVLTYRLIVLAIALGIARMGISILKDFKDVKGDSKHGKMTFLLRHGRSTTIVVSNVLAGVGLGGAAIGAFSFIAARLQVPYIVTVLTAIVFIARQRDVLVGVMGKENVVFQSLLQLQILFDGGMLVWVMLS